ncbi:agip110 [Agrotis ipsilon multiple nucleopolyhedrovirus]|uniref:Uncharacterized protein n=1 Tax=Agrotis ipsilon multiple nucleopolyhedrovirus TaxID=208013 RepID=B6D624_9ABAC|nr:agip110 [Agrotis ipsilon multiple nucleopolyhedrovirus]ACI28811.1 unknown [Agrotis ipsilon multiple nucleopolyhedrovirus]
MLASNDSDCRLRAQCTVEDISNSIVERKRTPTYIREKSPLTKTTATATTTTMYR